MERITVLYNALCTATENGWCVLDANGAIEYCNPAFEAISDVDASIASGVDFVQLLTAHRFHLIDAATGKSVVSMSDFTSDARYQLVSDLDESRYPARLQAIEGQWTILVGVAGSHRKGQLREPVLSSDQLRAALDVVDVAVLVCSADGRIAHANTAAMELVGSVLGENVGRLPLVHRRNHEPVMPHVLADVLVEGEPVCLTHNVVISSQSYEGAVELAAVPLMDASAIVGAVVTIRDVSSLRRTEEELRRAQHIESVAALAGGIAHDFNNVLTAVLGNISLAKVGLANDDDQRAALEDAEEAAAEARGLTQQLLVFSHGGVPVRASASIEEIVGDSANYVVRGSNVKVCVEAPEVPWRVQVERDQLSQLVQNIVMNAKEAMPEGGIVNITVENRNISKQRGELPPGRYVVVSTKDEGFGIPRKNLSRVFEPYFTTKSNGSGLGLAVAYSIVKNHDGYFLLSSEPGAGTTASVYFPAVDPTGPSQDRLENVELFLGKKVLIMDDEALIRSVLSKMLRRLGCRSSAVDNGNEAVYLYQRAFDSGRPFDLVILDLTVPGGMGGKDAMARIREIDPSAKVVVSSGYANDPVMADPRKFGFAGVITKPYSLTDLSTALGGVFA